MKKITLLLIISVFSAQFFFPATAAIAQNSNSVMVDYLVEKGKLFYERGNYVSAIHEFTKAVMVDPNNREAQKYLDELGASGGYYGRSQGQVQEVLKASEEIEKYKRQLRVLAQKNSKNKKLARMLKNSNARLLRMVEDREQENRTLMARIKEALKFEKLAKLNAKEVARVTAEKNDLYKQYARIKDEVAVKDKENRGLRQDIKLAQAHSRRQARDIERLAAERDSLDERYAQARQDISLQIEEKKGLIKKIALVESDSQRQARDIERLAAERDSLDERYAQARQDISLQIEEKKGLIKKIALVESDSQRQVRDIEKLADEKKNLHLTVAQVKQEMSQKETENKDLRQRIIIVQKEADTRVHEGQVKLEQARRTLAGKNEEVARLNDVLYGLKDQLAVKIALFKEKENKLNVLNRDNEALKRDLLAKTENYEREIKNIETLFDRYKKHKARSDQEFNVQITKLHDVIRKNRLELAFLNDRLLFTEYKLAGRDVQVSGRNQMIAQLKESLFNIEKELASFQTKNLEKGKKVDAKIAQQIVADAQREKLVKAKDKLITSLKMKLVKARKKIKAMSSGESEVAAVKEDLDQIKAQLRSQTALGKNELSPDELEAQIRDLQNKLETVEGIMRGEHAPRPAAPQSGQDLSLLSK